MIKRQLYRLEHPNNDDDGASDGSSSSSDEDSEPTHDPSTEEEEAAAAGDAVESPGSGYQSEDSSYRDRELNNSEVCSSSVASSFTAFFYELSSNPFEQPSFHYIWPNQLTSDEDEDLEPCRDVLKQNSSSKLEHDRVNKTIAISQSKLSNQWAEAVDETEKDRALDDLDDCVIKCKSVFRCKLCPRIVCLSQDTMRVHLDSKATIRYGIDLNAPDTNLLLLIQAIITDSILAALPLRTVL
eukprot:Gb_29741 [translate_table: standard]